jgi:hypothetical protein
LLILCNTPNIEVLSLNCAVRPQILRPNYPTSSIWLRARSQVSLLPIQRVALGYDFGKLHRFQRLRKVTINMTGLDVIAIFDVLLLDSLRDMTLFGYKGQVFANEIEHDGEWACPPKASKVENIRLDDFRLLSSLHTALLASSRHLRMFAVTSTSGDCTDGNGFWDDLIFILRTHQPRIEALKVKEPL